MAVRAESAAAQAMGERTTGEIEARLAAHAVAVEGIRAHLQATPNATADHFAAYVAALDLAADHRALDAVSWVTHDGSRRPTEASTRWNATAGGAPVTQNASTERDPAGFHITAVAGPDPAAPDVPRAGADVAADRPLQGRLYATDTTLTDPLEYTPGTALLVVPFEGADGNENWLVGTMRLDRLVRLVLADTQTPLWVSVGMGDPPGSGTKGIIGLFGVGHLAETGDAAGAPYVNTRLDAYGHSWWVTYIVVDGFTPFYAQGETWLVSGLGTMLTLLLFGHVRTLETQKAEAHDRVGEATVPLRPQASGLEAARAAAAHRGRS